MKLHSPTFVFFVLVILTASLPVSAVTRRASCDDGWKLFKDKCYFFSTVSENLKTALSMCAVLGSSLASPRNAEEKNYLATFAQSQTTYSWWLGIGKHMYNFVGDRLFKMANTDGRYDYIRLSKNQQADLPKLQSEPFDDKACIAYRPHYDIYPGAGMTTVACKVKLPFVCRGDPEKVTVGSGSSWHKSDKDVYWFYDVTQKLSHDDAQKKCASKKMKLFSIRNQGELTYLSQELKKRSVNQIEPFWMGIKLDVGSNGYNFTWTSGVAMDERVIKWLENISSRTYISVIYMLLSSGNIRLETESNINATAPYICQMNSTLSYRYGCPATWLRGGNSCYKETNTAMTWDNAKKTCETAKAHLLTIDSSDEMTWIRGSSLTTMSYLDDRVWVSLNDKKKENNFVWSDGSKLDTSLVSWTKPLEISKSFGGGQCAVFNRGELHAFSCTSPASVGCQYTVAAGKSCLNRSWEKFKNICYMTKSYRYYGTFNSGHLTCNKATRSSGVTAQLITISTKDVYNFLKDKMTRTTLLGLSSQGEDGKWKWVDGTPADLTIFPSLHEPDNGHGTGDQDCVALTSSRTLSDDQCDIKRPFVCERETSKVARTAAIKGGNSPPQARAAGMLVFISCLLSFWLFSLSQ